MKIVESTDQRLTVSSEGYLTPTTCTFDKQTGLARIVRQILFWRRPEEYRLGDIEHVNVSEVRDAASGSTIHIPVIRTSDGRVVPLSRGDEDNAADIAEQVRNFLGAPAPQPSSAGSAEDRSPSR